MVRKRLTTVEKLERKLKRAKKGKSLSPKFISSSQFTERLLKRKQMSLRRIIDSPGASPSSKKRAKMMLVSFK